VDSERMAIGERVLDKDSGLEGKVVSYGYVVDLKEVDTKNVISGVAIKELILHPSAVSLRISVCCLCDTGVCICM
jgi:hypothetical protein